MDIVVLHVAQTPRRRVRDEQTKQKIRKSGFLNVDGGRREAIRQLTASQEPSCGRWQREGNHLCANLHGSARRLHPGAFSHVDGGMRSRTNFRPMNASSRNTWRLAPRLRARRTGHHPLRRKTRVALRRGARRTRLVAFGRARYPYFKRGSIVSPPSVRGAPIFD